MLLLARVLWKYHLMLTVIREEFATLSLLSFLISSAISIQSLYVIPCVLSRRLRPDPSSHHAVHIECLEVYLQKYTKR